MSHVTVETLMQYVEGLLDADAGAELVRHLAECVECHERAESMRAFNDRLKIEWVGARLRSIIPEERGCPAPDELSLYFLGEGEAADRQQLGAHLEACADCREIVTEMERGYAVLTRANPLDTQDMVPAPSWWERLQSVLRAGSWPTWTWATVATSLAFVAGLLLRPVLLGPPDLSSHVEAFRIAKPPFSPPAELPALGIAPAHHPEAEKRFQEAMAFYADSAFPEKAIPKLREAIAFDPRHDPAQFWLGIAYLLKGEAKEAIGFLKAAVRLAPGRNEYQQYLLWAYLKTGDFENALRLQTEILQKR